MQWLMVLTELFYNNSEKLETTNNGINVTGHTETDTLHVSGISTFGGNVGIDTAAPNTKLNIFNESPSNTGGILVQNVLYGNNQDKPYLTAGTKNWTGATTNWGTHGFVHKFKTNSGGSPRITIDSEQGEQFSITNNGKVGIATTGNIGARLNIPISGDYGRETLRLVGNSESDWSAHNLGYIYSIAWGDPVTTQLGIGPYPQSKTIFPGSSYGMAIHYKSTEEFSLRSTGWDALFAVEGDTGNTYIQGNTGIGITNPTSTLQVQSGDMRLVDGNVIVASGHGIDFSATGGPINSATSQSELLDDFERGYWTPLFSIQQINQVTHTMQ